MRTNRKGSLLCQFGEGFTKEKDFLNLYGLSLNGERVKELLVPLSLSVTKGYEKGGEAIRKVNLKNRECNLTGTK